MVPRGLAPAHLSPTSPATLSVPYTSATQASFPCLKQASPLSTPGPLYLLSLPPEIIFLHLFLPFPLSHPFGLMAGHLLRLTSCIC